MFYVELYKETRTNHDHRVVITPDLISEYLATLSGSFLDI